MSRLREEELEQIARVVALVLEKREDPPQSSRGSKLARLFDFLLENWQVTTLVFAAAAVLIASLIYGASPFFYLKQLAIEDAEVTAKQKKLEYEADLSRRFYQLGLRLFDQGLWAEADLELAKAQRLDPNNVDIALARRNAAIFQETRAGEYDPSIIEMRLLHFFDERKVANGAADPVITNPHALVRLGQFYRLNRNFEKAQAAYEKALQKRPELAHAHAGLALLSLDQKDFANAILHFEEALRITPSNSLYLANLGSTLLDSGDPSQAIPKLLKAVNQDPHLLASHLDLARALRLTREYGQAWRVMKRLETVFDGAVFFKSKGKNDQLWVFVMDGRQYALKKRTAKIAYIHASAALSAHLAGQQAAASELAAKIRWEPVFEREVRSAIESEARSLLKQQPQSKDLIKSFFANPAYKAAPER